MVLSRLLVVLALLSLPTPGWAATSPTYVLTLSQAGTVTLADGTSLPVRAGVDVDNLTWVAVDQPGQRIAELTVDLILPKAVSEDEVSHQLLAIHGVESATSTLASPTTIRFTATGLGPEATVSVVADFPKSYLTLGAVAQASVAVSRLGPVWVWSSLLLPALGLLVLLGMLLSRLLDHVPPPGAPAASLPSPLPPALVSILYSNKIEPEAIAATLLGLASRGYLSIFNKGSNFIFAKERELDLGTPSFSLGLHAVELSAEELQIASREGLAPFEKILLSKLFVSVRMISSKEDVKVRIAHGVFSKKVAAIYEYLFRQASQLGYFVPGAAARHRAYLLAGWVLFGLASLGFLVGALSLPDPKYFLLFWAGLLGVSYLIVRIAPYVPVRTPAGRAELARFLAFRQTLVDHAPIKDVGIDQFFEYLPHAWALGAEGPWAARFKSVVFHRPHWYYSHKELRSSEEFVADLAALVGFVAESFASVRQKTLA